MTEQQNKLSRRDALKLLSAAAGASVLANLPSKWCTPEINSGVLPAHAQTSIIYTLQCLRSASQENLLTLPVMILPVAQNISLHYQAEITGGGSFTSPVAGTNISGDVLTDINGEASITVVWSGPPGTISILWTFTNASQGTGSCYIGIQ